MSADQIKEQGENEIDLIEVARKLWAKRKFILKVTLVFACLGILVALFSAKEYTASCIIVPQSGEKNSPAGLGGLAAIAGINLGSMNNEDVLSPKIYPKVLASVPFQKELMRKQIKFEEYDHPVCVIDYYTGEEYRKFSLMGTILKYTVGLPGVIMGAIRNKQPENVTVADSSIQTLSRQESKCMRILKNKVILNVDDKDGIVTLSAVMSEPLAAAQLASMVQIMLQRYITEFKIEKAQAKLKFTDERYAEAKRQFEMKQEELAQFRDANRNFASAMANIQVKEDTPIFTIVEPVTVPSEHSKPQRGLILIAFIFLGGFLGIGLVLVLPYIAQISGARRLQSWLPENKE